MSRRITREEMIMVAVSREIRDGDRVILGVGLPTTAGSLAKAMHARNAVLMTEAGIIDFEPLVPPNHIADVMCLRGFSCAEDLFNTFTTINYRGFVDKAVLGVGQVDRFGNVNTSFMHGDATTGMRLTGAGGAPDFISYARETILTLRGGEFVEKLDYVTSPGYLGGGTERDDTGLFPKGSGPSMLITGKGVFRFGGETKEMYLESVLPGCSVDDIREGVPWDLKVADPLVPLPEPRDEEIEYLRRFAPQHCVPRSVMIELAALKFMGLLFSKKNE